MSAVMIHPKTYIPLGVLGLIAAAFAIWFAFFLRDPDPVLVPSNTESLILMPDGRPLLVQRYEVTVAEWNRCVAARACSLRLPVRAGQDPETTPATGVSYVDAQEYLAWITARTGRRFRLPTTAEWIHMAQPVLPQQPDPIFSDPSLTWASAYLIEGAAPRVLKAQGSFSISPAGIADLDGSVWEWTSDCYATGKNADRCPAFYVGGEHITGMSYLVRDPARGGCAVGMPPAHLGLRLVTDMAS